MHIPFRPSDPLIGDCIDTARFRPSCITVIEGTSTIVPGTLFVLCARWACKGRDVVLVDGANSFNPYAVSGAVKFLGFEPGGSLSRIHVARAFTEYQMDAIMGNLREAIARWDPGLVAVLYLSRLFSTEDGKRLFSPLLGNLRDITRSFGLVTVVTSFGGNWWGDRTLAEGADRVIRIDRTKTHVRVQDGDSLFYYTAVPPGQTRIGDFTGGGTSGQNCAELQVTA